MKRCQRPPWGNCIDSAVGPATPSAPIGCPVKVAVAPLNDWGLRSSAVGSVEIYECSQGLRRQANRGRCEKYHLVNERPATTLHDVSPFSEWLTRRKSCTPITGLRDWCPLVMEPPEKTK